MAFKTLRIEYHYDRTDGILAVEKKFMPRTQDAPKEALEAAQALYPGMRVYCKYASKTNSRLTLKIYDAIDRVE